MANEEMIESKRKTPDQINFTLKVTATNLPIEDDNFKIKLSMDFGSQYMPDLVARDISPNFNARKVRNILKFISQDVIRKVIEFIYFKEEYVEDGKPAKVKRDPQIDQIYLDRSKYRQTNKNLSEKPGFKEEEKTIAKAVEALINDDKRVIHINEKSIANIRFEHLSPGVLSVNVQKIVNGDMPPPR
jgi:hypothetical protein